MIFLEILHISDLGGPERVHEGAHSLELRVVTGDHHPYLAASLRRVVAATLARVESRIGDGDGADEEGEEGEELGRHG